MSDPREQLARELLGCGYADVTPVQRSVIDLIANEAPTGVDPQLKHDDRTVGQRLADRVAEIGGSWGFIIGFALALVIWMGWNMLTKASGLSFDPYPFIFLNLMLSMLAAIQAPIIMMSQNRQAAKDRLNAAHDYEVNLKAEIEIMGLHDKLDQLRSQDIERLLIQQQEQITLLTRLVQERR